MTIQNQNFWEELDKALSDPDSYDIAGGGAQALQEYFAQLGATAQKVAAGTLSTADLTNLKDGFKRFNKLLGFVDGRLNSVVGALSSDELKIKSFIIKIKTETAFLVKKM
jgi:hypothetical protein